MYSDIDHYIAQFPAEVQKKLLEVRETIKNAAPKSEECISYQIPTFKQGNNLVHFAGYSKHIGFYPGSSGIANFKSELASYKSAKGSVQFPLTAPLPLELIDRMVRFRVQEVASSNLVSKKS